MGLLDKALGAARQYNDTRSNESQRASRMSDEQLKQKYRNTNGTSVNSMAKKAAYREELENRGYIKKESQ